MISYTLNQWICGYSFNYFGYEYTVYGFPYSSGPIELMKTTKTTAQISSSSSTVFDVIGAWWTKQIIIKHVSFFQFNRLAGRPDGQRTCTHRYCTARVPIVLTRFLFHFLRPALVSARLSWGLTRDKRVTLYTLGVLLLWLRLRSIEYSIKIAVWGHALNCTYVVPTDTGCSLLYRACLSWSFVNDHYQDRIKERGARRLQVSSEFKSKCQKIQIKKQCVVS